ncbi:MAG: hypothetical protein MJY49_03785 [Bacteroidales bacterium]|nr:hypothetical protein [Bacteroidales bacterium]
MKTGRLSLLLATVFLPPFLCAEAPVQRADRDADGEDKYVRLMSAQTVRLIEKDGKNFRKADGPARFLHNDTWLICDTALWDVDAQIIHAMGHVSIEQEQTELVSDSLNYFVDRNVAEFRGALVQLQDKDGNVLRTRNLDYNTKDSVAIFRSGASMRDKDGQLIESSDGSYDSRRRHFEFRNNVNMFTDSVFVKTAALDYVSDSSLAVFNAPVDAWRDKNMLSGDSGWWDRSRELFFFSGNVHVMSETQEGWSDSLYVHRSRMNVEMLGNAQVTDTVRAVTSMAGRIYYCDSLSRVDMEFDPVVMLETTEKDKQGVEKKDSVYFRADTLVYWTTPKCAVDSAEVELSSKRLEEISSDPVANIRAKAAEEAAKKRQEAIDNDPNSPPEQRSDYKAEMARKAKEEEERLKADAVALDSFLYPEQEQADSLEVSDTVSAVVPGDSTKIGFLYAKGNVKVFRKSMQAACDSLRYSDLDSLGRLFKDPVVWNEGNHQYNADSIYVAVKGSRIDRAHLLSDAFIHIEEEEAKYYDQIKGAEMTAYFDEDAQLRRFDALGSASAIFYMKEKEKISTANKKEATMLSAEFLKGEIQKITYFESPKSDVYPIAQMRRDDMYIKGYRWDADRRPKSVSDITSRVPRPLERKSYDARPRATFAQTEIYFSGYMDKVYAAIARSDSLRRAGNSEETPDTLAGRAVAAADSVDVMQNTLDSLLTVCAQIEFGEEEPMILPVRDIDELIAIGARKKAVADSLASVKTSEQLKKEAAKAEKERKAAERRAERKKRDDAREAKWAAKDEKEAQEKALKEARKKARKERKEKDRIDALLRQKEEEDALYEQYKKQYLEKFSKRKDV